MVVLSSQFTFLAALSSIAAVSALPTSADSAAVAIRDPSAVQASLVARHSRKGGVIDAVATTNDENSQGGGDGQDSSGSHHSSHHAKTSAAASKDVASHGLQRAAKPVVPLPAVADKHGKKKGSGADEDGHDDAKGSKKHEKEARAWEVDPVSRMRTLWIGSRGVSVPQGDSFPLKVDRRHHHHDHDHDRITVKGDDDHVDVHERSLQAASIASRDYDDDRIHVTGQDDHVDVDENNRGDDRVDVHGAHDRRHVRRSPMPHHHHHHDHNGDVVLTGDHDHLDIHHRRYPPPHRFQGRHPVALPSHKGGPTRRSPMPAPVPHHRHHHHDKVVVAGDHDRVNIHRRQSSIRSRPQPMVISGSGGNAYRVEPQRAQDLGGDLVQVNIKRDYQESGVPGKIDIMGQDDASPAGKKIASLVVASPDGDSNSTTSPLVLNASDVDHTPMYLVRVSSNANNSSSMSNSTTSSNSTDSSPDSASNSTSSSSYIPVLLQTDVFDAQTAQLDKYCATFDPRPEAPGAMTVEGCKHESSGDVHKSQIFAYEPGTGAIRPMWFDGEDDNNPSQGPAGSSDAGHNSTVATGGDSTAADGSAFAPSNASDDGDASVTSFEQEALNEDYGDATRPPPMRFGLSKIFTAEAIDKAQNVTLLFTPMAPEVKLQESTGQDEGSSASTSTTSLVTSSSSMPSNTSDSSSSSAITTNSSVSLSTSTAASSGTTESTTTSPGTVSSGDSTSTTSDPTATPGSTTASSSATAPTDSSSTTTMDDSDMFKGSAVIAAASPTAVPAFEVKVYNPFTSDLSTTSSGDAATSTSFGTDSSSLTTSSSSASSDAATPVSSSTDSSSFTISSSMDSSSLTITSSSVSSAATPVSSSDTNPSYSTTTSGSVSATMTPVSVAPSEWMFKQRSLADLD